MDTTISPLINTTAVNQQFISKIHQGFTKEAEDAATHFIRQKLREDGFLRRLFNVVPVSSDELDPNIESDKPMKILEKDFDTKAMYLSFRGTGERQYFESKRFPVYFDKIETDRVSKSMFELMTYRIPVQDLYKEYNVKEMQAAEDRNFIDAMNAIVTDAPSQALELKKSENKTIKDAFIAGQKMLTSLRLPVAKALMHKNTFIESLNLKIDTIGNEPLVKRFNEGIDGEESFMGIPVVTTIKDDIIKEGEIYFFTSEQFFGRFYALQDATMVFESKADMLTWWSYESIGMGIGNTKGVVKITMSEGD